LQRHRAGAQHGVGAAGGAGLGEQLGDLGGHGDSISFALGCRRALNQIWRGIASRDHMPTNAGGLVDELGGGEVGIACGFDGIGGSAGTAMRGTSERG